MDNSKQSQQHIARSTYEQQGNKAYRTGLDGIRAIAVIAVIVYHLHPGWMPGGLLGVGIFFVLSGYLITSILLKELEKRGKIDLKAFWIRRAKRLLPGMLFMIAVTGAATLLFAYPHWSPFLTDLPGVLLYVSNWSLILHHVSYFESFGPASPLGHLWSLAVEEQFYLVWPLMLLIGLRFLKRRRVLLLGILGLAVVSAAAMAWLYQPDSDPSRVYYGTDTRLFGLLFGAALALVWPFHKLKPRVSNEAKLTLDIIGGIALLVSLLAFWYTNEYQPFLYLGGMLILSFVSVLLIMTSAHPASRISRLLSIPPLRYIGVRSYGLYLWHYPVIILTSPAVDTGEISLMRLSLQLVLMLVLAAVSFKYVEQPLRYGSVRKLCRQFPAWMAAHSYRRAFIVFFSMCLFVTFSFSFALRMDWLNSIWGNKPLSPVQASGSYAAEDAEAPGTAPGVRGSSSTRTGAEAGELETAAPEQTPALIGEASASSSPEASSEPISSAKPTESGGDGGKRASEKEKEPGPSPSEATVTAIGDSVMLDIQSELEKLVPSIAVDGQIGRQMSEAPPILEQLQREGSLGDTVIIELGTNGAFASKQLTRISDLLKNNTKVILVNTRVPRPWEQIVNDALAKAVRGSKNMTLVDWNTASSGQDDYFSQDGVHLTAKGAKALAALIARAV
ncbi:acyltransferase family protein [Paenibacillus sp. KS-LC4]|uniref:acyltransferase family protein n=1 Tax=Paenibacillus sp. KS-LC4 TaxID=2979727 RepID=UPI0030D11C78